MARHSPSLAQFFAQRDERRANRIEAERAALAQRGILARIIHAII